MRVTGSKCLLGDAVPKDHLRHAVYTILFIMVAPLWSRKLFMMMMTLMGFGKTAYSFLSSKPKL